MVCSRSGTVALTILYGALSYHRAFIRGLHPDRMDTGGTAFALIVVVPTIYLSALLAAVGLPSTVMLLRRAPATARSALGLYILVTNAALVIVLAWFGAVMVKVSFTNW